jgi:adenylosuccinate lyase
VGSSVARDFPIIVINLQKQLDTLNRKKDGVSFLERITIDRESCQRNFEMSSSVILAEPLYIALQMAGYSGDAHELVNRQLVPMAKNENITLMEALKKLCIEDTGLETIKNKISQEVLKLLHDPKQYTGDAEEKALEIASYARQMAQKLMEELD